MDRKDFLAKLLPGKQALNTIEQPKKKQDKKNEPLRRSSELVLNSGLAPYAGSWTKSEVIHLLKRLTFGAPKEEVDYFSTLTYTQAVDLLLNTVNPNPGEPLKHYTPSTLTPSNDGDWGVAVGKSWVNNISSDGGVNFSRRESLKCWWMNLLINQPRSIEEKMILFWTNHFAVEFDTVGTGTYCYQYLQIIRKYALGNLKQLTRDMTLSPAMLVYLNGQNNNKTAPDENYARELQELFLVGKGPDSLYTEDDVKAAAKVLTGWRVDATKGSAYFTLSRHDITNKQFSSFYGNALIAGQNSSNGGDLELDAMLNMIFLQAEVAKYICRRIYRFFVYGNISATVESNVITPLADTLRSNGYEIKPVLNQLFKSEHFFDVLTQGAMIKSPIDFVVGTIREFKFKMPPANNTLVYYRHLNYYRDQAGIMEQNLGDVPNVSGWPAYYQHPEYDNLWINTDTYTKRQGLINTFLAGYTNSSQKSGIDVIEMAKRMPNPADPNALVADLTTYLLRIPLSQTTRDRLKVDLLLTGQAEDHYWSDAWNLYLSSPFNTAYFNDMNNRLRNLITYLLNMEEYHLM
jgi:uncharacterized protein (DUF1800 family)